MKITNVTEYEAIAKEKLPKMTRQQLLLLVLQEILGFQNLDAHHGCSYCHAKDGEYATARAASAAGTIMTLSSWATSSVEEVASTDQEEDRGDHLLRRACALQRRSGASSVTVPDRLLVLYHIDTCTRRRE
ncbi:hypothetical protein F2Q69_00003413 [Brassica cretica]|uniref:FMN-dependent dehydrogenase domain-containing protein n=1 Tax=Brassica cretica TaxID=69181 RepID=A0A8S9P238_BRACR|nr:hypothetical protein F2Q69_00003413 [Brassica cretica]